MPITIEDVCRSAWESTRPETAVPYDELIEEYRAKLIARAEAVLAGTYPSEPWLSFETQVCQLADGRGSMQVGSEPKDLTPAVKAELVEEVEHQRPKGHLPDDFPAYAKLHEAGINTYGQLAKIDDYTTIDGIGPVSAKEI